MTRRTPTHFNFHTHGIMHSVERAAALAAHGIPLMLLNITVRSSLQEPKKIDLGPLEPFKYYIKHITTPATVAPYVAKLTSSRKVEDLQ